MENVKAPQLNHPEVEWLYKTDMRIEKEKLQTILDLPHETLIADLETTINHAIDNFEAFKEYVEEEENWNEEELLFPVHAIFLLGEIGKPETLDIVLDALSISAEFNEFWFEDFLETALFEPIIKLGKDQLDILSDFVKDQEVEIEPKIEVALAVRQLALNDEERLNDVLEWFNELLIYFAENQTVINLELAPYIISEVVDLRAIELFTTIEELLERAEIDTWKCGELKDIKKEIKQPLETADMFLFMSIVDRYQNIIDTWSGYNPDDDEFNIDDDDFIDEDFDNLKSSKQTLKKMSKADR